ncbi:MAG: hypothetical protein ACT4N5_08515 [Nitrosopumilaceae archaeon]
MFIHKQTGATTVSGIAEQPGNDLIVSLGDSGFAGSVGSLDQQEGTFMHEIGHNLKMDHGGGDANNCKPNYLSVMSWSRQFREFYPTVDRDLDYSRQAIGPRPTSSPSDGSTILTESALYESGSTGGIDSYVTQENIVYGISSGTGFMIAPTGGNVNWNGDLDTSDNPVTPAANINWMIPRNCDGTGTSLTGMKDWGGTYIDYSTKDSSSWSDGVRSNNNVASGAAGSDSMAAAPGFGGQVPEVDPEIINQKAELASDISNKKIIEYNYPTLLKPTTKLQKYYEAWMDKFWVNHYWNNTKVKNSSYKIPQEITSKMVREFRSSSVDYLDSHVQNLNNNSFSDPQGGKATLHDDFEDVKNFVSQDDLHSAVYKLLKTRDNAIMWIDNNNTDLQMILSKIDNVIAQFEIASTTYENIPYLVGRNSTATISFEHPTYEVNDIAIVTVIDSSSNLDNDNQEIILARLSSTTNPVGIIFELRETGDSTGIFQSGNVLNLVSGFSDATREGSRNRTHNGDSIWASYNGAIGSSIINHPIMIIP